MTEIFSIVAFIVALAALALGSEIIRRLNSQHDTITALTERLLALQIQLAEQEQSYSENAKTLRSLEALAKSATPAAKPAVPAAAPKKVQGGGS